MTNKKKIRREIELGGDRPHHYEVFARQNSSEPLAHVGSVEAPNEKLAKARAWYVFDHVAWREMCLVPTTAIVPVLHEEQSVRIKGA